MGILYQFYQPFGVDNYYLFQLNANSYTNYSLKHPQFLLSSGHSGDILS